MIASLIASLLMTSPAVLPAPCPAEPRSGNGFTLGVCDDWLEGAPAYAATFSASLTPFPAAQQVIIFRYKGGWRMAMAGYHRTADGAMETRRKEVEISDAEAETIARLVDQAALQRLAALPYYGSDNRICMDGANLRIETAAGGQRMEASQHSCAGKTEINTVAAAFRDLALKHDRDMSDHLDGLRN